MAAPMRDPYTEPTQLVRAQPIATAPQSFPLRKVIEGHGDVLGPVCRSHGVDAEAVIAQLWVASQKQPGLLKANARSLVTAVARALETGGVIGRDVHLLTFKDEVTECLDYKFMAELVVAAGGARSIDARIVYAGDTFKQVLGSAPSLVHEPPPFGNKRGAMIGAYAVAFLGATVPPKFVALTLEEIEATRQKSRSWGPDKIAQCPEWYAAKTAVRRLVKLLPKNPKLAGVLSRLDAAEAAHEGDDEIVVTGPLEIAPTELPESDFGNLPNRDHVAPHAEVSPELARALAYQVKGRTLAELADDELTRLEQWAHDKGNTRVADMCGLVLHHRTIEAAKRELDAVPVA